MLSRKQFARQLPVPRCSYAKVLSDSIVSASTDILRLWLSQFDFHGDADLMHDVAVIATL